MSEPIHYPPPWKQVFSLTPHIARGTRRNVDEFSREVADKIRPEPIVEGWTNLPEDPRFVLAANHYEREGLWILHTACLLTQLVRRRYGVGDPPVRWMVTANWPPWKIGPWKIPSPGDWLLPKVAFSLGCYPVSFAGSNPEYTARTIRQLLKDTRTASRPLGIFPEGVGGRAGKIVDPLPGVDRLLVQLARKGWPVVPVGVGEAGRFVVRIGPRIPAETILSAADAATLVMASVAEHAGPR